MDDDQVEVEEENKENIPVAVEALPSIKLEPCNYDEIDDCHQKTEPQSDNRRPFSSSKQPKKTQFPSWSKNESFKNKKRLSWPSKKEMPLWSRWQQNKGRRGNDKKHPGLGQVLSPKALYPSAPPPHRISVQDQQDLKIVQASSGGSSSSSMAGISNSSSGGSNSSSSRITAKRSGGSLNNNGELDLENLEYPDSPTSHKWFADNADLSPLTVLDNMNLKTEFPYSTGNTDVDKPPDINSITLDSGAENLFQFAASVPNVPDNTTTFLDIGTDTFSQSLYDDLINMNDFPNVGAFATATTTDPTIDITNSTVTTPMTMTNTNQTNNTTLTTVTLPQTPVSTTSGLVLTKPITLEKLELDANPLVSVNIEDLVRLKGQPQPVVTATTRTLDLGNLLPIINVVSSNTTTATSTPGTIQVTTNDQGASVLRGLIEPLPASALKGLIKIEPSNAATTQNTTTYTPGFIKIEPTNDLTTGHQTIGNLIDQDQIGGLDTINPVFSPLSMGSSSMASPGSPNSTSPGLASGGGKMKSTPSRKKSTSSSNGGGMGEDEDLSNIPSLQTRIQIISQRVSSLFPSVKSKC